METGSPQMENLIFTAWLLLIPVAGLLMVVLGKLIFLMHGVSEFMTFSRYELYPTLKDLRQVVSNAEILTDKAVTGAETIERSIAQANEKAKEAKSSLEGIFKGGGSFLGAVLRAMLDKK